MFLPVSTSLLNYDMAIKKEVNFMIRFCVFFKDVLKNTWSLCTVVLFLLKLN